MKHFVAHMGAPNIKKFFVSKGFSLKRQYIYILFTIFSISKNIKAVSTKRLNPLSILEEKVRNVSIENADIV